MKCYRRLMILDDHIKQANEELKEARENLKKVRPPTAQMRKDIRRIEVMENKVDQALLRFNQVQTVNKQLRGEIDVMRKEQRNQLRVNRGFLKDIQESADDARKLSQVNQSGQRVTDETNNQILALKSNHEDRKIRFESQIKNLQDRLNEKEDGGIDGNKENSSFMGNASGKGETGKKGGPPAEFSNPIAVLKLRLSKWESNNREKKHLMDAYVRNVKVIEDSFSQITEATGIRNIEEIVTTFIKT